MKFSIDLNIGVKKDGGDGLVVLSVNFLMIY